MFITFRIHCCRNDALSLVWDAGINFHAITELSNSLVKLEDVSSTQVITGPIRDPLPS